MTAQQDSVQRRHHDYGAMLSCRAAVEDFRRNHGVNEPIVNIDGKGVLWRKARQAAE